MGHRLPKSVASGPSTTFARLTEMVMTTSRLRTLLAAYPELAAVLVAAAVGLSVQRPLAWLAARQGINVLLAVLVFATAVTVEPAALRRVARAWRSLLAALAVGVTVLPALAWAASRVVPVGPLRDGVLAVGLAPCEIASVATTAMAGGEAAVAAGVLIGSTVAAVAVAGPILALEAGHAGFSPGGIVVNLALVVALPLAAGLALRASVPATARAERAASSTAVVAVAALVALIAAEVHLSASYTSVAGALALFLLGSALAGWLLGRRAPTGGLRLAADHVDAGLRDRRGPGHGGLRPARCGPARLVRRPRPGLGHRRSRRPPSPRPHGMNADWYQRSSCPTTCATLS
jgi:predicted Na+-dependent transporter